MQGCLPSANTALADSSTACSLAAKRVYREVNKTASQPQMQVPVDP